MEYISRALKAIIEKRGIEAVLYLSNANEEEKEDSDLFIKLNFYEDIDKTAKHNTLNPTVSLSEKQIKCKVLFTNNHVANDGYFYEDDSNFNTNPSTFCFIDINEDVKVGSIFTLVGFNVTYVILEKLLQIGTLKDTIKYKVAIR